MNNLLIYCVLIFLLVYGCVTGRRVPTRRPTEFPTISYYYFNNEFPLPGKLSNHPTFLLSSSSSSSSSSSPLGVPTASPTSSPTQPQPSLSPNPFRLPTTAPSTVTSSSPASSMPTTISTSFSPSFRPTRSPSRTPSARPTIIQSFKTVTPTATPTASAGSSASTFDASTTVKVIAVVLIALFCAVLCWSTFFETSRKIAVRFCMRVIASSARSIGKRSGLYSPAIPLATVIDGSVESASVNNPGSPVNSQRSFIPSIRLLTRRKSRVHVANFDDEYSHLPVVINAELAPDIPSITNAVIFDQEYLDDNDQGRGSSELELGWSPISPRRYRGEPQVARSIVLNTSVEVPSNTDDQLLRILSLFATAMTEHQQQSSPPQESS